LHFAKFCYVIVILFDTANKEGNQNENRPEKPDTETKICCLVTYKTLSCCHCWWCCCCCCGFWIGSVLDIKINTVLKGSQQRNLATKYTAKGFSFISRKKKKTKLLR